MIRYIIRMIGHNTIYYAGDIDTPCKCLTTSIRLATLFITPEKAQVIRSYLSLHFTDYRSILIEQVKVRQVDINEDW